MIEFSSFYRLISKNHLSHWLETLLIQIACWHRKQKTHGKFKQWNNAVDCLPKIKPNKLDLLHSVTAESEAFLNKDQMIHVEKLLRILMPWRKGPFFLHGININTEWRSDWKWNRILPHLSNLAGRIILDVGSGNGYYLWRMIGAGAQLVIGIDPMQLFLCQFEAIRKLLGNDQRAHLLPLRLEQLPALAAFDTVFSMGVLYHCRSPLEHLWQLNSQLVKGGELVLETLVINGDENTVLLPKERYAKMHNVYFIPSALALKSWVKKCGFVNINVVNINVTSVEEQRRTDWMTTESLKQFLDQTDHSKTIEGYPAPMRALLIANKPVIPQK